MKNAFIFSIMFLLPLTIFSQMLEGWHFGAHLGASSSKISGLSPLLIPDYYQTDSYVTSTKRQIGILAGIDVFFKLKGGRIAFHTLLEFNQRIIGDSQKTGDLNYKDFESPSLEYDFSLRYSYLNISPSVKIYPFKFFGKVNRENSTWFVDGINLNLGMALSPNLNSSNLSYHSNDLNSNIDKTVEANLERALKGTFDFSVFLGGGIEILEWFYLDLRYNIGLKDVIETYPNNFELSQVRNSTNAFQITIGFLYNLESKPYN